MYYEYGNLPDQPSSQLEEILPTFSVATNEQGRAIRRKLKSSLRTDNDAFVDNIIADASSWSISHSYQGHILLGVNNQHPIGVRVSSPVLEKARGSENYDKWVESATRLVSGSGETVKFSGEQGERLLEAGEKAGIDSLDLLYNHGLIFAEWISDTTGEVGLVSAYDRETHVHSYLIWPKTRLARFENQVADLLTGIKKWRTSFLPAVPSVSRPKPLEHHLHSAL